jgi:hypothetical protein
MNLRRLSLAVTFAALALPALAGPFSGSEAQLRKAYGAYRAALFLSNQGKGPETAEALEKFAGGWNALSAAWTADVPPQYADDAQLGQSFEAVKDAVSEAHAFVQDGMLPEAHEALEAVRDLIGDMHLRNGLIGFSDRMNAYHAAMEEVLATDYAALGDAGALRAAGDAAVLGHLAGEILAHPAPEAADPAYAPLIEAFAASVAAFRAAAESGDVAAASAAQKALKLPYAKLFAKFG